MSRAGEATQPCRVLFASPVPPPVGGISIWTRGACEGLAQLGFDVDVLDTSPPGAGVEQARSRFRVDRALRAFGQIAACVRRLRSFRPQVVHINTSYHWAFARDGILVWLASWAGARTLLHFHGGDLPLWYHATPPPLRGWVRATMRRADALVAITRETEAFLRREVSPTRVVYLPNFVPSREFETREIRAEKPLDAPVEVLFVGWLLEAKGVAELARAVHPLPQIRLTLAGPVHREFLEEALREELDRLGDRVRVLGALTHEQVHQLYGRADVFALPSHQEGFPLVVVEAMAAGLPVVSTRVGAIPDIVRDGTDGFLVEVSGVEQLRDRIDQLAGDPALRRKMGESGRERARGFARDAVLEDLGEIYRRLLLALPPAPP